MHSTLIKDVKLHIDSVFSQDEKIHVVGWCASPKNIKHIRLKKDNLVFLGEYGKKREDVKKHYKDDYFLNSGFYIILPEKLKDGKNIFLEILEKEEWKKAVEVVGKKAESMAIPKNTDEILKISSKPQPTVVVLENFYENPDAVRQFALSCEFKVNEQYHKGSRTETRYIPKGAKELFEKCLQKRITKWEEHGTNGVFQYCTAQDSLVYHVDLQTYAAMVYLTPNPPPSCGTTLYQSRRTGLRASPTKEDEKRLRKSSNSLYFDIFKNNFYDKTDLDVVDVVGNVYNRLIIFNAQAIHSASQYFGDSKENSRLFHIFFFDAE